MTPLHVTATLDGPIVLQGGPLALDALLAAAVAMRDGLDPPAGPHDITPIEIPVEREPEGRFHLASFSHCTVEDYERRWVNRRPVVAEAQALGSPKRKRMQINAGPDKGYRFPMEAQWLEGDRLDWWCIGEREGVEELLRLVHHLGKRRAVGLGRVREWTIEPCERWGPGFPVVDPAGRPLRPLPLDWPGVIEASVDVQAITYPYWAPQNVQEVVVP